MVPVSSRVAGELSPTTPTLRVPIGNFRNVLDQRAALVRLTSLFSGVALADCLQIVAIANERLFQPAKTVYLEGDDVHQAYLVISGCVKLSQVSPNGDEVILRLIGPGECFGLGSFANTQRQSTAKAIAKSQVLAWDARQFEAAAVSFPVLRSNVASVLTDNLHQLEVRYREVSTQKVATRVSAELFRLLSRIGKKIGGHVEVALSQRDLAQLTGTTLFTVSRLLSEWKSLGIVSPRREAILVLDTRALEQLSLTQ